MVFNFRFIVLLSTVLSIALWVLPYVDYIWLTQDDLDILGLNSYHSFIMLPEIVLWGFFIAGMVINVGLFFFIKPARWMFFIFYLLYLALVPFSGIQILTSYEYLIYTILVLLDGGIFALLTMSEIRFKFDWTNSIAHNNRGQREHPPV